MNVNPEKTKSPLVSVICPTYNAEKFILNTLTSIITQDYPNIEIVVSDDCSSDDTVVLIKKFIQESPEGRKIILNVNEQNLGITANCNKILSLTSGKYVSMFAGDDIMYQGKIAAQVAAMEKNPDVSLTYHSVNILDGDDGNKIVFTTEQGSDPSYRSVFDILRRGGIFGSCSVMVRADAIPPGGFASDIPSVSDWLMLIEVALRGRVLFVPGIYAGYTKHVHGSSRKTYETLHEITCTLDKIDQRFAYHPLIKSVTNAARKRYLLGEIARLFLDGDCQRLKNLRGNQLVNSPFLAFTALMMQCLALLRINRLTIVRRVYIKLSGMVK